MDIGLVGIYSVLFLTLYVEVFLLLSFLEQRPTQKTIRLPKRYPTVSIVVPCFNEQRTLAQTVKTLLALNYPKERLDILIVDDGSTDGTQAIGERLAKAHKRVQYFRKENGGKYTALNFAIDRVKTELVGCLDADSFVTPDALLEVVKTFEDYPDTSAVAPAMYVHQPRGWLERMQAVEYMLSVFIKKAFDNLSAMWVLPGPFSIYKREVFDAIGPFRHAYNTEDSEIALRMQERGLRLRNVHTAIVYTKVPTTPRALIKQRTRWSQGFLQNSRDYAHMYGNPRYGHLGLFVLPTALASFAAAIYATGYILYTSTIHFAQRIADYYATGIPPAWPTLELPQFDWFFLETSMMTFLTIATLALTLALILYGKRIGGNPPKQEAGGLSIVSLVAYFTVYGFIAPFWLVRAAWGAALARQSSWR